MNDVLVRFWGVRGSVPVPGPSTLRYGGNTSCVELRCGPHLVVLDAGSGLEAFGRSLSESEERMDADMFLTHPHLDHIMGLPFFSPLYRAGNKLRLRLPKFSRENADWIEAIIGPPYFPLPLDDMGASIERTPFAPGETLRPHDSMIVKTIALAHPGGASGIRVEYLGRAIVYVTDVELPNEDFSAIARFAANADLLICDAQFTEKEMTLYRGWGHSSWQDATQLAYAAEASRLVLFHHAPGRTDDELDEIGSHAARLFPQTEVASEGLAIHV
jgi:phosphoribosyl 1,2-cyclic phosphodiesterase